MTELINGRTPEEIKAGLIMCTSGECNVYICPYRDDGEVRCSDYLMEDALALIQNLEAQQPKWISVKERLPENGELVLVTMNGEINGAKLFNRAYELACYYRDSEDEEGEYHIDGWELWDYREGEVRNLEVFYWMPLPKEPEEEGC